MCYLFYKTFSKMTHLTETQRIEILILRAGIILKPEEFDKVVFIMFTYSSFIIITINQLN
jgi:hypothetical protein